MVGKIDEKNPEVLAKKIIAQGRNLEKSKSSAMLLSPRSKVCSMFSYNFQHLIFHSTEYSNCLTNDYHTFMAVTTESSKPHPFYMVCF